MASDARGNHQGGRPQVGVAVLLTKEGVPNETSPIAGARARRALNRREHQSLPSALPRRLASPTKSLIYNWVRTSEALISKQAIATFIKGLLKLALIGGIVTALLWPIARDLWNGLQRLRILVLYNGTWVLSSRADEFRKNADECRQQAARSKLADDRERWLRVAQHFLQMAREAETEQSQQS
jgi:hypothetical protein